MSRGERAWLCRLSTGFASGADLVRFLADARAVDGPPCYFEPGPVADGLLRAWEAEGVIVRGRPQPLTLEQRVNASDLREPAGAYLNHFGWSPGPAFEPPTVWTEPPRRPEPSWIEATREVGELPRGTRDAEGFLLVPCFAGGVLGRVVPETSRSGGAAYCDVCSRREPVPLRPDGRLERHLCPDLSAPRKTP